MSDKITHEIVRHLTTLGKSSGSWNKELNLVSWNGREPKLDLRDWPADHGKCGKGITLSDTSTTVPLDSSFLTLA